MYDMNEGALGTLEVICDAPPYEIVRACSWPVVGMDDPEDCRWERVHGVMEVTCPCGHLITLRGFQFTHASGDEVLYRVGQCPNTRRVYWDRP